MYLQSTVLKRLNEMCNDKETFLDFIRDSERHFGLEEKQFYGFTIEKLDSYIDFLGDLWFK